MKYLLTITTLYVLLSLSQAWSLPTCPGSPSYEESIYWNNCIGTYTWSDGNKYAGEWKDNKYDGQGTFTFANGDKYVGEFKDDKYDDQGAFTFANGDKYVGKFKDNKRNGQGTYTHGKKDRWEGDKYVGGFKNDKRNGQGTYSYADGRVWQGQWENDAWVSGRKYAAGEYNSSSQVSSLPICPGSPSYDGSTYWDNCIGTYTWADGTKYLGEWKDNSKNGQGSEIHADGSKYEGKYKDDKRHGQGTFTWANGDKYVGEYKNNERHGQGTATFADGNKYAGEYKNGKRHGQGTGTWADGEVWQGLWKNDEWVSGRKYAAGEYNPPVKEKNNKQNIDPNEIINTASGSGFIVSSSGHIVTNNHVINGCNEVKVHYEGEQYKASILSKDDYNDLALLKATFTPSTVFTIKNGNAELMEDIYVAGYPFGDLFNSSVKITKGIVSSLSGFQNNFSNMQIDAALQPGNSGGPVIDYQGNIVGVAVAKLDLIKFVELFKSVPENTNFAIKSSVLLNFLNSNGLKTKKASEQIMPRSELSEKITKGTLFLSCWMTYARIEEMKSQKVLFNNIIK